MNHFRFLEADAGLWFVHRKNGQFLGCIFDGGSKIAEVRCRSYEALEDWYNITPGRRIGRRATWMGALSILCRRATTPKRPS